MYAQPLICEKVAIDASHICVHVMCPESHKNSKTQTNSSNSFRRQLGPPPTKTPDTSKIFLSFASSGTSDPLSTGHRELQNTPLTAAVVNQDFSTIENFTCNLLSIGIP